MYEIGDYIIYGGEGVCRVKAIGAPPYSAAETDRLYYTLEPVYHSGIIYTPVDVSIKMRPILTKEEALELIRRIPNMTSNFEHYQDARQAAVEYRAHLETYDCENLLHLIRLIYDKNSEAISLGKNYGQIDDRFFKRAKELLYGELAMSLDIPFSEVESTIVTEAELN